TVILYCDSLPRVLLSIPSFRSLTRRPPTSPLFPYTTLFRSAGLRQRYGWKALVTNARPQRRSLEEAVLCYRHAYRVERVFNRLKSRLQIAPLFVKLNDQIEGLTYLLTLGVRVLTVTEFVLRRSPQQEQAPLSGLHLSINRKMTAPPLASAHLQTH